MTREEREFAKSRIEYLLIADDFLIKHDREALEMAIQALSQEPISLDDINNALEASFRNGVRSAKVQKSGKWIRTPLLTCDRCNKINKSGEETDYCPSCGAKMESEEISERNMRMWEEIFKAERSGKE